MGNALGFGVKGVKGVKGGKGVKGVKGSHQLGMGLTIEEWICEP